jgi:amino acid transporter, AAT family
MTTSMDSAPNLSRQRTRIRTLPWYTFGLANLAVVCALGFASWYLLVDPSWGIIRSYPQPLTAWLFWTIIAFVWAAFTFELSPFARLPQPWRGLAVAVATGGLGALITWGLAAVMGSFDVDFAASRADGLGYVLGSLIVLYSFVLYTMSAVNWGHWPWPDRGLRQPWLGAAEGLALLGPVLILYVLFAVPALTAWAKPGSALMGVNTQIGYFYCVVVSSILTGAVLGNWPWRLAGRAGRVAAASLAGNLAVGAVFYYGLGGVARLVLGASNVHALTASLPVFSAEVGVCWVFWLIMWPNAFANKPAHRSQAVTLAARTVITLGLAVATFALYYYVLGRAFHEPASAPGASVHGSALVGMDWLIIWALWYVAAAESWGLPRARTAETLLVEAASEDVDRIPAADVPADIATAGTEQS